MRDCFSHMTAHQVAEATQLAFKHKDFRLALLLSQSSQTTRNMLHKQLTDWQTTGVSVRGGDG